MWLKIIFLVLVYLVIGKVIINITADRSIIKYKGVYDRKADITTKKWVAVIFFPLILTYLGIHYSAKWISDKLF